MISYLFLTTFCLLFYFVNTKSLYVESPETKGNFSNNTHLKLDPIKLRCMSIDKICRSGGAKLCALRMEEKETKYKDFENACYLFFNNMCENPGREFFIVSSGSCEHYINSRRNIINSRLTTNATVKSSPKTVLRTEATMSTLYDIDTAFDFHMCPMSCPDTYEPVCVSVNRGYGRYFKFYTFVNHCSGDLYYCKHWQEFKPPPTEDDENVVSSKLGWSFCGSSRYLQFARFAEVTSSMGHYGWLAGNYKFSHIMEPHERKPGYG